MSLATDTRLDLDIVQSLDFEYTPPCESAGHRSEPPHDDAGAYALVRVEQECGHNFDRLYCKTFTQRILGPFPNTCCSLCGAECEATYTIVSLVN